MHTKTVTGPDIRARSRAYLSRLPPSIQGSRGSDALFVAATALVKGFNLAPADAFPLLAEWNAGHAVPPWSVPELLHKLKSATATSRRQSGWLLYAPRRTPATAVARLRRRVRPAPAADSPNTPCPVDPAPDPQRETGSTGFQPVLSGFQPEAFARACGLIKEAAAEKAQRRAGWPRFSSLIREEIEMIAALRKLPLESVDTMRILGFVVSAKVDGHCSFILHEEDFAQARRFDGLPFTLTDGRTVKAKNLPGSKGHFIGSKALGTRRSPVLLVEGAVALMEGIAAAEAVGAGQSPSGGWAVLAATSAYSRMDAELLEDLAGRRVRIVPDADPAGLRAAANWTVALRAAGAVVDAFRLPAGIKDLGPLVADPGAHRETLQQMFTL